MTQHKSKDNSPAAIKATLKGAMESMFGPDDPAIAAAEQDKIHKQIERLKNALAKGDKKPLEKFAGKPDDALSEIIKSGRIDLLTALLDAGLDVSGNKHYGMVLREAIDSGHADIVRLLIDRGADLDITLSFGSSMLHEAAQCGHAQVI